MYQNDRLEVGGTERNAGTSMRKSLLFAALVTMGAALSPEVGIGT
jgi:hypothetical protein